MFCVAAIKFIWNLHTVDTTRAIELLSCDLYVIFPVNLLYQYFPDHIFIIKTAR